MSLIGKHILGYTVFTCDFCQGEAYQGAEPCEKCRGSGTHWISVDEGTGPIDYYAPAAQTPDDLGYSMAVRFVQGEPEWIALPPDQDPNEEI